MQAYNHEAVIIDYGLGNLYSVLKACEYAGISAVISNDKKQIEAAQSLILPGVGAFGSAMNSLEKLDLVQPIRDFAATGRPLFGVCLGMQLFMSESEEFGAHKGLGLIEGVCRKFNSRNGERKVRIPQIAWNTITSPAGKAFDSSSLLHGLKAGEYMYFVHSYYVIPEDPDTIITLTTYEGQEYSSGIAHSNIFALQFHPEKSSIKGLSIYKNFKKIVENATNCSETECVRTV
jgi:glutamine amidotransferase